MAALLDSLWQVAVPIYAKIEEHPFLNGLTDGTLPEESFRYYVLQDAHYLRDFGRGLALLGTRTGNDDDFMMFCQHGANAIMVERALHAGFFKAWGLSAAEVAATPVAPTCLLYTSYLLRVAHERPFHEALAAFLPCYWIYREVGKRLTAAGSPHPLYRQWIATYGGEEFGAVVKQVLAVAERAAAPLTEAQRDAMRAQFVQASRFEWMFWEMGWQRQGWPV